MYICIYIYIYEQICLVGVCEVFHSVSILIGHSHVNSLCGMQASMKSFFRLASIGWCACIAITQYLVCVKQYLGVDKYFLYFNNVVWVCELLLRYSEFI